MSHDLERLTPYLWKRGNYYLHWCPACKCGHTYPVGVAGRPNWSFDGNIESPSFRPSMLIFIPAGPYGENEEQVPQRTICHYYLLGGQIQYQMDCHHGTFAGKTVPLEPIPEDYGF